MQLRVTADAASQGAEPLGQSHRQTASGHRCRSSRQAGAALAARRHGETAGWIADRLVEKVDAPASNGHQPTTEDGIAVIIREAARAFGQPEEDLLRVGRCESNLDPRAVNPDGPYFGLFQFLRSTWASTPFADRDIFDPVANAHAAAWMWQQGRRHEWACQ